MNTFEINIQRKSGNHWPIVVEHSRPGELLSSRSEGILKLSPEDFQQLISKLGQPKDYGIFLGQALFQDEIRDAFVSALRDSEETLRVLLFIEAEDKEIRTLRWERLCGNIDDGWHLLSLEQRTPFSLYIPAITDRRFPPIGRRDLRALILVASPEEIERYKLDSFDVEAAVEGVRQALGIIPCDVLATVKDAIGEPTLDELCKHLTDQTKQYTLLHFVSHSRVIMDSGETILYWAKADNKVDPVTGTRLIERLRSLKGSKGLPHFTFLSTCESASPEAEAGLGGFGQRLVRDLGMPAVIAMTEKITVKTALALGAKFYEQLSKSGEVDIALQEAAASLAERQDITVPALFSRLGGRPLFSDQLDRNLTNKEIKYGLERLQVFVQERSPILQSKLEAPTEVLANLLNTDSTALSKQSQREREQALEDVNNLSQAVVDLSFNAIALGQEPPIYDARCPFLGLYPFRVENQKFFFGRERLITQLQQKLEKDNFLAVFGASGSGKSSVILAGLIPALIEKQPELVMAYMTPSSNPIEQLQASLLEVENKSSVLVIDQFEELFTLCTDEDRRLVFIDKLLFIIQQQKVVVTMRADFWGECASYPQLKELMQTRQELIGPMDTAELRKAMEMQAAQVGLRFEPGLSNRILDDVQGEPGAMPLLQHALLELWKRRHGRWLRSLEYDAIGGVNMAIAQTADAFYDICTPEEQEQVKNIFVRLTRLDDTAVEGQKRRDTRRRVWLEELIPAASVENLIQQLLKRLAGEGSRLIVTSVDSATQREEVEVAHEALIRYWPRLLNWLDENRSLLHLRENIRQAALDWDKYEKDESYLVRGGRLKEAEELLQKSHFLNILEANYVQVCVELRDRQKQEQETRRRREIRARWIIFGGALVVIVTTSLGLIAFRKGYEAQLSKADSLSQTSLLLSTQSHQELQSLTAGIKAAKILKKSKLWTGLTEKISLGMIKNNDQVESQSKAIAALQQAINGVQALNSLTGHKSSVNSVVFSHDGQTIATASNDKTIKLWNLDGKELRGRPIYHNRALTSVVFSPDDQTLLSVTNDKTIKRWNLDGNEIPDSPLKYDVAVTNVVFSPDGKIIATARKDKTVKLWNFNGKELTKSPLNHDAEITSLAFSPDGKTLATASKKNPVKLWDFQGKQLATLPSGTNVISIVFSPNGKIIATASHDRTVKLWNFNGKELQITSITNDLAVTSLAFSPDGKTLATASKDNTVILWDLKGNQLQTLQGHQADITSLAFSPDSTILASASKDNTVIFWNLGGKLLQTFSGHQAAVTSVAFSPDGKTIASASIDNTVQLWDLAGKRLQTLRANNYAVTSVAFSPDAQTIAAASVDNTLQLWQFQANFLPIFNGYQPKVAIKGKQAAFTSVVFAAKPDNHSPNCQILASASKNNTVQLWNLEGKILRTLRKHKYAVTSVALGQDCQTVASASVDKTIILWDLKGNQRQILRGHQAAVTSIAFSPDGRNLASGSEDKTIILWDLKGKKIQTFPGHQAAVTSVAFSPDGKNLASGSQDHTVILWDLNGQKIQTFRGHKAGVTSVAFSPDGKNLVSGSDDNTIKLWDLTKQHVLKGHQDTVNRVIFSPNGKTLASASDDNNIKLWDLKGNELPPLTGHEAPVISIVFSPDGKILASGSEDKTIKLWDLNGNLQKTFPKHEAAVTSIVFSRNGKILVSASKDKTIKIWDLKGNLLRILKGHQAAVTSIVFSPDGKTIASGSEDNTIKLWDFKGNPRQTLKGHQKAVTSILFSPDGKTIASGSDDKTIKLWDLKGNQLQTLTGHQAEITNIVFSRDGKTLASGSEDKTIKLWDLKGNPPQTLKGHKAAVTNIVFSRDGKTLASGSEDKTIKLWDLKGNPPQTLFGHEAAVTSIVFSPNGYTLASGSSDNHVILWDFNGLDVDALLDQLTVSACDWTRDYLENSQEAKSDKRLCDRIGKDL